jgi:hypothetical protein
MNQNHPVMVMTEVKETVSDMLSPRARRWLIVFFLLVAVLAIFFPVEVNKKEVQLHDSWTSYTVVRKAEAVLEPEAAPEPDPYAKYEGQPVAHPRRQPDALVTIKISRYDPRLGGTNCFHWGNGTCLSSMANGERWEENYEKAVACAMEWAFGTIVEIEGKLWECKDRGGAIIQTRPGVYWVDQLSTTGHYDHGYEMPASVWFPQ